MRIRDRHKDLRGFIESFKGRLKIVFRDDDVTELNHQLWRLLTLFQACQLPLHLAIVPSKVQHTTVETLRHLKAKAPRLLEFGQHGFAHENHGAPHTYAEFGRMRSYEQQHRDIAEGKRIMEKLFEEDFAPVFTPPYHHYDTNTLRCLDELGFRVFSRGYDEHCFEWELYEIIEVSMNLDPVVQYVPDVVYAPEETFVGRLKDCAEQEQYVGILLHHDTLTGEWLDSLESVLEILRSANNTAFPTLMDLAAKGQRYGRRQLDRE